MFYNNYRSELKYILWGLYLQLICFCFFFFGQAYSAPLNLVLSATHESISDVELIPYEEDNFQVKSHTISTVLDSDFDETIFDDMDQPGQDAQNFLFSGSIQNRLSKDTKKDAQNENDTSLNNRIIMEAGYKNIFFLSGISDFLFFGSENESNSYDIDLHETYLKYLGKNFYFSIGKQIKRWGKADQISFVDTLNPENLTEFIIPPYEDRKIPIWMLEVGYRHKDFFIESIFIPFFRSNKFKYFGTDWAFYSHLKDDINDTNLPQSLKDYFSDISVKEIEPEKGSDQFEYAFRIGKSIGQLDVGLTYHYTTEDSPCIESFPVKNLSLDGPGFNQLLSNMESLSLTNESIIAKYLKNHIVGFEFETVASKIGIRGEAAWKENQSLVTRGFTSTVKSTLSWILGADYTSSNNWYINLQFAHQYIDNFQADILFYDRHNFFVIGEISKEIISDWLEVSVESTYILNDTSYYLSPRIIYSYLTNLHITLGVNIFQGDQNSYFGQYTKNDQVFITAKYYF
ncbi:hypothetical protein [Desulfobacter curvatus]|uniref:hypothetical protein n=1 Tax=Desulfobacter curvatus TaxID=2290 RepID=UPI0003818AE2|nr:hypothetical protein [Desulfobacter curvatus]